MTRSQPASRAPRPTPPVVVVGQHWLDTSTPGRVLIVEEIRHGNVAVCRTVVPAHDRAAAPPRPTRIRLDNLSKAPYLLLDEREVEQRLAVWQIRQGIEATLAAVDVLHVECLQCRAAVGEPCTALPGELPGATDGFHLSRFDSQCDLVDTLRRQLHADHGLPAPGHEDDQHGDQHGDQALGGQGSAA